MPMSFLFLSASTYSAYRSKSGNLRRHAGDIAIAGAPFTLVARLHESRSLKKFEMLDYGRPRDRQLLCEFPRGAGLAGQALRDHYASRMSQ